MLGLGEEWEGEGVKPNAHIVRIVNTIDIYGPSLKNIVNTDTSTCMGGGGEGGRWE